jgi:hypothetical protein
MRKVVFFHSRPPRGPSPSRTLLRGSQPPPPPLSHLIIIIARGGRGGTSGLRRRRRRNRHQRTRLPTRPSRLSGLDGGCPASRHAQPVNHGTSLSDPAATLATVSFHKVEHLCQRLLNGSDALLISVAVAPPCRRSTGRAFGGHFQPQRADLIYINHPFDGILDGLPRHVARVYLWFDD